MKFAHYLLVIALLFSTAFQEKKGPIPNISGPEQVLRELENALSSTSFDSHKTFKLYREAAQHLAIRGSYKEADSLFIKADALVVHEADSILITEMNLARANMYKEQGKYTVALQAYMEALTFYQKQNDVDGQLWVYGYLVEFYRATLNADLSLKFIEEAENLMAQKEVKTRPKAYLIHAKATYFLQFQINEIKSSFKEMRAYLEQALTLAESTGDSYLVGLNQNGLGFLLMHNDPSESTEIVSYLESAKNHMLANERYRNYTSVLQTLSLYYTRSGRPEMAVELTFEAIELSKKNNWDSNLGDLYRLAGEVHYELGQFKESAVYLNMALEATIENMVKIHSIELGELTTSYEKAIAEQKLSEQQIEIEIAQKQAVNNRKALITTVIISVILLTISIISIVLYNRFRKANALLRTQEEITRKTNQELNNAVEQKNVLYKELNHRVKNNLTVLSSLIHIQEDGEKNKTQRDLYQTLRHRIQSMALVHQNLYQLDETLNINFQQYLRKLIPSIASAFNNYHDVNTAIRCESLLVNMDEAVPLAMIINELITNSFKHAFEKTKNGKIELWSDVEKDKRHIHYKDNGPGMPEEPKTSESQKLGMMLIRLMVQQLNGELIYNGDKSGLYFIIALPVLQRS
ncbi:sensor histidine kinase [Roseivirga echinicomitans]|uniref:histidine kinase n=1 Tax=Roseivirga echinicomitans TaxID=296218 RepID=A0A150X9Q4_9BACT|nr:histidine kinase dimerization/phosphoacceptor domain -containing protein [Roseivirga echinicomitans]KYG75448.1 hypothetical protein AWN68_07840 [Roseivirga echinicomitans]